MFAGRRVKVNPGTGGLLPSFKNYENCFELYCNIPTNVTKHVELISCFFTTSPGGRAAGGIKTKAYLLLCFIPI